MAARTARLAFAAYAITTGLSLALGLWHQHLFAVLRDSPRGRDFDLQLQLLGYLHVALAVMTMLALAALTRLPAVVRARRLAASAAATTAFGLMVYFAQQLLFHHQFVPYERVDRWLHIAGVAQFATYAARDLLLLTIAVRVARSVGSERLRGAAIAAMISRVAVAIVWLSPAGLWSTWLPMLCQLLIAVVCAGLAVSVMRLQEEDGPAPDAAGSRLPPGWRAPAQGISLYLGGALARVLFALLSYAVTVGAGSSQRSLSELRDLREQLLVIAALGGGASLTMLAGLWRISRAPVESRASDPALIALALGILGFGIDVWTTSITAEALDGHLAAAFFAMKALPAILVASLLLGIGAALALLRALGNLATALDCSDVARRARDAIGLVVAAGVAIAIAAALSRVATELLVGVAVMAVPLAILAAVQLIRVAMAVGRVIHERVAP